MRQASLALCPSTPDLASLSLQQHMLHQGLGQATSELLQLATCWDYSLLSIAANKQKPRWGRQAAANCMGQQLRQHCQAADRL